MTYVIEAALLPDPGPAVVRDTSVYCWTPVTSTHASGAAFGFRCTLRPGHDGHCDRPPIDPANIDEAATAAAARYLR